MGIMEIVLPAVVSFIITAIAGKLLIPALVRLKAGQSIKVLSGPLADFDGIVSEVNAESGKIKVMLTIFGRETPVELTADQVSVIG